MRIPFLFFVLLLLASCGRDGGGGASSSVTRRGLCDLNGRDVDCATIRGADGEGIDLLEAVIDVPVKVSNGEITFLADRASQTQGRRIDCRIAVRNGERYGFTVRGDALTLTTSDGALEMDRISDGEGLTGAWMWKGYVDQGTHIIRKLTVVEDRAILRTHCEL